VGQPRNEDRPLASAASTITLRRDARPGATRQLETQLMEPSITSEIGEGWTFLRPHGLILFHLLATPTPTLVELSKTTGLSERRISAIIRDLSLDGVLAVEREGRRNVYRVRGSNKMRHHSVSHLSVCEFASLLAERLCG
jgi:hypothetical protein